MLATLIFCFHCEFKNTQRRMFTLFKQKPRKRERRERERKKLYQDTARHSFTDPKSPATHCNKFTYL